MLTTLLAQRKKVDLRTAGKKPIIEILNNEQEDSHENSKLNKTETENVENVDSLTVDSDDNSAFTTESHSYDWKSGEPLTCDFQETSIHQLVTGLCKYGFANQHSGVFLKLQEEIPSIVDCPNPDHMTNEERRIARIAHEQASFDPDHYLADLMEDDQIKEILKFKPSQTQENSLSEHEKSVLKDLPNKEYLLDSSTNKSLYLGLVDIIFAYAYNHRITEGESTVESAWTICKLSSTMSWLEEFKDDLKDVVYTCFRRSLCYPLYRHWELTLQVLEDTKTILKLGKHKLLQCLLSLRQLLAISEPYYIMNNLYVTDYCVWSQYIEPPVLLSLIQELDQITITKSSLRFDLCELEGAAYLVLAEEDSSSDESCEKNDSEIESEADTCDSPLEMVINDNSHPSLMLLNKSMEKLTIEPNTQCDADIDGQLCLELDSNEHNQESVADNPETFKLIFPFANKSSTVPIIEELNPSS